jgi:hypothetical protein
MKSLLLLLTGLLWWSYSMANVPVNEKVLKAFNETFKDVRDVNWHETGNQYMVYFIKDDIRYNVTYDKDGKFLGSKRYYYEDRLPMQIVLRIKKRFRDKSISSVTEILDENGLYYFISLEDDKALWILKVNNNDFMEVTKRWRKN